jgi:hypothetical protein
MPRLLLLNHVVLLLCCSIYLGTGVSLALFDAPFTTAPRFFTIMTIVMLICGLVMLATEWLSGLRWIPVVVVLAVVLATALTAPAVRFALWIIEWIAMTYWFYRLAYLARADR